MIARFAVKNLVAIAYKETIRVHEIVGGIVGILFVNKFIRRSY